MSPSMVFGTPTTTVLGALGAQILGEHGGVGVGIVAADDDQAVQAHISEVLLAGGQVLGLFDLVAAAHYHIEPAGVAIRVDDLGGQFLVLALDNAARAFEEAEELAVLVGGLERVEQARDHVVSARRLSARENHADLERFGRQPAVALDDLRDRLAVGVGKQLLDLLLIGRRMRGFAQFD